MTTPAFAIAALKASKENSRHVFFARDHKRAHAALLEAMARADIDANINITHRTITLPGNRIMHFKVLGSEVRGVEATAIIYDETPLAIDANIVSARLAREDQP